jgi:hypothetical protein
MISPVFFAVGTAALMAGLFVEACAFKAFHDDPPSTYKLFAVRDKLVRLVVEGKIARREPHFDALYKNINIMLRGCRRLSGPDGWERAEADGRHLARHPHDHAEMVRMPDTPVPPVLDEVSDELRYSLEHLINHHFGIFIVLDERRREQKRMQKERAKEFLKAMEGNRHFQNHTCAA